MYLDLVDGTLRLCKPLPGRKHTSLCLQSHHSLPQGNEFAGCMAAPPPGLDHGGCCMQARHALPFQEPSHMPLHTPCSLHITQQGMLDMTLKS